MVCITSSTGFIPDCTRFDRAMRMPSGMPTTMATSVQTRIMAIVRMVSSHIPK